MADNNAAPYGFRVVGGCYGERRLVDWQAALAGYAACDSEAEVEREAYLSAYQFPGDLRDHILATGSTKHYAGPCGAYWLPFDLDAPDDPQRAMHDARRLCAGLVERYSMDEDSLLAFFSGSKGFHVSLPMPLWGAPEPSVEFARVVRKLATNLADELQLKIDGGIYDRVRLFRAPNSRHPKTGLHKRRLEFGELLALSLDSIRALAARPEPFDLPLPPDTSPQAVEDWAAAAAAVDADRQAIAERRVALTVGNGAGATLNRRTLDFIREGAFEGDRHRLLFSAAANLAEFGCPPPLAHALLTEAGRDAGLPPSEVRRVIECGLAANGNRQ